MEDQIKATIASAENHVRTAYGKLEEMGATMPTQKNIQNLRATVYTLPLNVRKVTVTFDAGEGTPSPASQELYPGQIATEPVNPTKEGCLFLGWYKTGGGLNEPLTASQYSALNLTARRYDNYGLTAKQYDTNAKNLLK